MRESGSSRANPNCGMASWSATLRPLRLVMIEEPSSRQTVGQMDHVVVLTRPGPC